jgi:hypothetical protein
MFAASLTTFVIKCSPLSYNLAIARSNTDVVVNSVIILFINDLDEQFFGIITSLSPKWVEMLKYSSDYEIIQSEDSSHSEDMTMSVEESRGGTERKIDELQVKDEIYCSSVDPNNLVQTKITNYYRSNNN